jgi:DNA-directed RNA polymerase subunit RPC12/RpoP
MSMLPFDDDELNVPCPSCGQEIPKTLAELRARPGIKCPDCGFPIHIDLATFDMDMAKLTRSLDRLFKRPR